MAELNTKKSVLTDETYAVEKVLRKRIVREKVEYLLKWAGFSSKHNSWEPEENVVGNVLIEEFNRKQKEKGKQCKNLELHFCINPLFHFKLLAILLIFSRKEETGPDTTGNDAENHYGLHLGWWRADVLRRI